MLNSKFFVLGLLLFATNAFAQDTVRSYYTKMIVGSPPSIDGILDDEAWELVEWAGDFTQRQPVDGAPPSQPTRFKILYDERYLYFGIEALDSEPDKVVRRMSRRDGFEGDLLEVNIDSYHDKRTAFSFTASASGVKGDEYVTNNGDNWDSTWDPIWYLKTSLNDKGWVAEFKIPLSQLRFADKEEHVWGIQVMRAYFRNQERSYWQPIAQDSPGWIHLFGELRGITGIKPQKQLEIQPYLLAQAEESQKLVGDPYHTGSDQSLDVGVDAKIGLTSDVTLDLTVNPDFGQVEADPSQVNLSAFQLFFRERRPFFLEGNNILNFGLTDSNAGGRFTNDNLFYSRRIGALPSYYPGDPDIAYVDKITNTKILGAAKITGKNKNGFSWGLLESMTRKADVEVTDTLGQIRDVTIAPFTNYLVGRVQQDINEGNALIGGMFTATNRSINDAHLEFLNREAYSVGLDFTQNFNERNYYVSLNAAASNIQGSEEAITRAQQSSVRFFQRPDNRHAEVDTTRTSLSGTSGTASFGKRNGNLIFQSGATFRSPGFETNDAGFLRQSDFVSQWTWAQYRILKPFGWFRFLRWNVNQYFNIDFDGVTTGRSINTNIHTQFKNFWFLGGGTTLDSEQVSNADLRGGPAIRYPGGYDYWLYVGSNDQKKLTMEINPYRFKGFNDYAGGFGVWMFYRWQPFDALRISFEPSIDKSRNELQYVDSYTHAGQERYVLGQINQRTYSGSFRVNYNLTPNLTIEFWGQPFIAKGEYEEFKDVLLASSDQFHKRYQPFSSNQISWDGSSFHIDRSSDGEIDYSFSNPNFNIVEFRSNMVLRWEYIPGSTLFLVWTSNGSQYDDGSQNSFRRLAGDIPNLDATHIFLIKYTYRIIL